ncbi:AIR synthase-related protein [Desulforegula conservatrix]|uniref:AIR synthase-related protein n=1 Tax=Desulforegula conservatrix TaxID=153026 RepID=UPI00041D5A28|nr:AIR synthase-related protein [Desulforegula conservatrix]
MNLNRYRIEIAHKPELKDAEGAGLMTKASRYFGMEINDVRTIHILTVESCLDSASIEKVRTEIFTNPVTQISSTAPLDIDFDWCIWVGYRPGVKDNPGSTAVEAMEDVLSVRFSAAEGVYTSKRFCIKAPRLTKEDAVKIASELLANDIIQHWKVFSAKEWDKANGIGIIIPKVELNHTPTVSVVPVESDATLAEISRDRNLALNPNDIPVIRQYFSDPEIKKKRAEVGLSDPTDVELEYISQARSDHCNHNTFRGLFKYSDLGTGESRTIDNLFKTCIQQPTLNLKDKKDWVVSVLWDNAGAGKFDEDYNYVITGETHNSPSNMEAYGGAVTGIVGVYRDPLGTGKGARLVMGGYGFCTGYREYDGELKPRLHPRRLLDGVIEGVKDGGNKSGVPTPFGQVVFDNGYMGKCLVFVTAIGIMPSKVSGKPSHEKTTSEGELIIMSGGRVGKDGIHGVTASSEVFSANTPAGHVQIGDPYTQKKMHDFLLEVRDAGIIEFITDNGGGGLSSSIGETARFSNGCEVNLEKVPLKYEGLDQWEIWVSESQERMTIAIKPENLDRFMELSRLHAVESTVIGKYSSTGKLHIKYNDKTVAYVDMEFLESGFPQWEFEAEWIPPRLRGLYEPVIGQPADYNEVILDMMSRPNICAKSWICRQYDHEVQAGSVVKPLVGRERDINSDAAVLRPVIDSESGLAYSQAIIPFYSKIDAGHMTACTIDEAVRRIISVGGSLEHIGGVDNYCWPDIQFHPEKNPDGKFKAAQLVRSCEILKYLSLTYGIPLLSGKDSMYVDGHLPGKYGVTRKVSGLETMQFSAVGLVKDVKKCTTLDFKFADDLIYVIGLTKDELGAGEYYEMLGFTGLNVPEVDAASFMMLYKAMSVAMERELLASVHGVYRGGLATHLAMCSMAGNLGIDVDLSLLPVEKELRPDRLMFSESAGRFIVSISPENSAALEDIFKVLPVKCIGKVTASSKFVIKTDLEKVLVDVDVQDLKTAWKKPYGGLI